VSFDRAHARLDSWIARPAAVVPITTEYERALRTLTGTGAELALEGETLIRSANPGATLRHGHVAISEVRALAQPLAAATVDLDRAQAQLGRIDTTWLVPPLANKVHDLQDRVARARREAATGIEAAHVLPALFGADATRHYFVAFQTPSEERANGGIIGNYAVVSFTNGSFDLVQSGRNTDLNKGGSAHRTLTGPAGYVRRYARFQPESTWQNVTMSPDFPSVGRVIAGLYPQSGGAPVDGVISVDPYAVAAILKLTGPVPVPGLPFALDAKNAAKFLLHDQYTTFASNGRRIDFLGEAIDAVIHRLKTANLPKISTIAQALGPVVSAGRLKLFSAHATEQHFFARIGAAGAFPQPTGDFAAVTTQNASGNKIDIFEHRSVHYDLTLDPASGRATGSATITLRNDAPDSGLPPLVISGSGPNPTRSGTSRVYVSLYSPLALQRATVDGNRVPLDTATELGHNVFSGFVLIPSHRSVTLRVDLAGRAPLRRVDGGWEYDLSLWHQPTIGTDAVTVTVHAAAGYSIHPKKALRAQDGGVSGGGSLSASETFAATVKAR